MVKKWLGGARRPGRREKNGMAMRGGVVTEEKMVWPRAATWPQLAQQEVP